MSDPGETRQANRYSQLVQYIFSQHYVPGARDVPFDREELAPAAQALGIVLPKNLGDVIYSFRYRIELPEAIRVLAPEGEEWTIQPAGRGRYAFVLGKAATITPSPILTQIKVPDATPGIIAAYALSDEQALLAKLRYNRLIDIFTGVTCYSLQNHLRTTVRGSQMETDELYVGVDRSGVQYVIPVQAKGHRDRIGVVQIEQDRAMCAEKFPTLVCRPVAAQFMAGDLIAMFELVRQEDELRVAVEKHYRLVSPDDIRPDDLAQYQMQPAPQQ